MSPYRALLVIFAHAAVGETVKREDDVSLRSLESLVQQQAATIQQQSAMMQSLQTKVAALESRVSSLQTAENKLQQTVAFTASLNDKGSVNIGNHAPIRFNNVITNIGNGYNPQSGIFTAPVAGVYVFYLHVENDNIHGPGHYGIDKSGVLLTVTVVEGPDKDRLDKGACMAATHLNAGEHVTARHVADNTYLNSYQTSFSGFLIAADTPN